MNAQTMETPTPVDDLDWPALAAALDEHGFAQTPPILTPTACRDLRARFDDPGTRFRSTVDMASHSFGRGRYRYLDYPLPEPVASLRQAFYPPLARIANEWAERLAVRPDWPATLAELLQRCRTMGQRRPTPLLLRYRRDDYNCLHQDLYGTLHFPLQVIVMLSQPGEEFAGGELVLVEQRPRRQSRAVAVLPGQGAAVVIPVRDRPGLGRRGYHRLQMRHGVSRVSAGERTTLGLIFHDAA